MKYFVITRTTTLEELKKQYTDLAKLHHPDRGGNNETMQEINLEYERALKMIKDQARRSGNFETAEKIDEQLDQLLDLLAEAIVPKNQSFRKLLRQVIKTADATLNHRTGYRNKIKGMPS